MRWTTLFAMQQKLDTYIVKTKHLERKKLFEEKMLALLVELGELANETRCFKFWSNRKSSAREVILEEYADNLHFILSLGLDLGYRYKSKRLERPIESLTSQFNLVFASCLQFKEERTEQLYDELFTKYIQLGILLGFTEEDIYDAYFKKNEINFRRQAQY